MTNQGAELSTIKIVERLFNFIKDNFDSQDYKGIDISWRNKHEDNKLILALENSEDSHGGGSTADGQLIEIQGEIDKLKKLCVEIKNGGDIKRC